MRAGYKCRCTQLFMHNFVLFLFVANSTADWSTIDEEKCEEIHGHLEGLGCNKIPDVFFWSCLLFLGTFTLSYALKGFRNHRFFPSKVTNEPSFKRRSIYFLEKGHHEPGGGGLKQKRAITYTVYSILRHSAAQLSTLCTAVLQIHHRT